MKAKKTVVLLEDDIDGSEASETVFFAVDGNEYEIDLNAAHATELREALKRYVSVARKSAGRGRAARKSASDTDTRTIREWAKKNGIEVNSRGRIHAVGDCTCFVFSRPTVAGVRTASVKGCLNPGLVSKLRQELLEPQ